MGGANFAGTLFEAGLVDEVGANIHPVLLGSGVPLIPPLAREHPLELIHVEQLAAGCVYVLYRVTPCVASSSGQDAESQREQP
jgi:riboflavin biosynthesis pyrimidine reductase